MNDILTMEESRTLIKLCQYGRLFEIKDWISRDRSLELAPQLKKSILSIAVKTGFHSLVETIAPHVPQPSRNDALADAIKLNRLDLVELLLASGAEINAFPFTDVLLSWNPLIISFFLEHGADVITCSPFAVAFGAKIRTALRAFFDAKRKYPDLANDLQEQADCALRKFAYEGDLKWVSLLMWAGGNPRSRGHRLEGEYGRGDEEYTTALEQACYQENVEILRRLKPDPEKDDLSALLRCASLLGHDGLIKYLLELGAQPNDKANGGSTAIDHCLQHIGLEDMSALCSKRWFSLFGIHHTMQSLKLLISYGGAWRPDDTSQIGYLRKTLYRGDPEVTVALLEIFIRSKCCSQETIQELLRPARTRQHLKPSEKKLLKIGIDLRTKKEKAEQARIEAARQVYSLLYRYDRDRLYNEVWLEPLQKIARKYGVSDDGLAKACTALDIPRPRPGYWAKKAAGKPVTTRPPLPPFPAR